MVALLSSLAFVHQYTINGKIFRDLYLICILTFMEALTSIIFCTGKVLEYIFWFSHKMKTTISQANIESLFSYVDGLIVLGDTKKLPDAYEFHPRLFRKRQYLSQEGDVCTHFYFLLPGLQGFGYNSDV